MSESDKRKPLQLIGVLAVVALGINLIVLRISQGESLSYSSRESQHEPAKSDIVLKPRPSPLDEAKEKALHAFMLDLAKKAGVDSLPLLEDFLPV